MKRLTAKGYIGDRAFYRRAMTVALPIMLQNAVTNFVSLVDNIMVGQTGTASMSGVAVVGQLFFVFYLIIFGSISGPGIFCAQFWGGGERRAFKAAFRFKALFGLGLCALCMVVLGLWGRPLVDLYLTGAEAERQEVRNYAAGYLRIMLWSMLPYTITMLYSSTLRETGQTTVPMAASWAAVAVNLVLNWVLIFGRLGLPVMGVRGAALATVVSRLVEMLINLLWSHAHRDRVLFTENMLEGVPVSGALLRDFVRKSVPLMLNESLWCVGTATLTQIYSTRGLQVVAALNIAYVLQDLFISIAFSAGMSIGILVGQELGAGELEKAVETDRKLLFLGVCIALCIGAVLTACSGLFPSFYNTTDAVRALAARLIRVMAAVLPFECFAHGCYFTLRSGGRTMVTFLFDSVFSWVVAVPTAYLLAHFTGLGIVSVYALSAFTVVIKCCIGAILVHNRYWVNTLSSA